MFQPSNQVPGQPTPLSVQDPAALMQVDKKETSVVVQDEVKTGGFSQAESIIYYTKKLQDDLQMMGMKIKQHEDNIKLLKSQKHKLDDSILDLQGKYHTSTTPKIEDDGHSCRKSEEETTEKILQHEKSAAGILWQLKTRHGTQAALLSPIKDVVGIVEYLGIETMLAIVCKTYEGVKALEVYENEGCIKKSAGLHGLGSSIGRTLDSRFQVICLENLRPYAGASVPNDPQMRLDIIKPSDGAISLDGGMIRSTGVFSLGNREDVDVRFPILSATSGLPENYFESERQINELKRKKDKLQEDMKSEQSLLDNAKFNFDRKKQDFLKFLADSSSYVTQHQLYAPQGRMTPR
ncbi:hypothetical protein DVH24_022427 [Malus domestica]|uniref:Uncharacterized protein n=1 Tax=Malus domestica TaxID=3750 RepID=A0A498KTH2_MALDO|nr:hypothetical protein DVH24_022427 [Malus domestica]